MSAEKTRPAILVVEDEALVRMYAVEVLADEGFTVIEAGNAAQALTALAAHPEISVLFTDINMPGELDGFALAREVHARRPDIHLILTSGKMIAADGKVPGAAMFLPKPYRADVLALTLSNLLH
jgi:CheY-like chemotaxis protein